MKMTENVKKVIVVTVTAFVFALLLYFGVPRLGRLAIYIFGLISPFVIAYICARLINPAADRLQKHVKLSRSITVALIIVLFVSILAAVAGFVGYKIYHEVKSFAQNWPETLDMLRANWHSLVQKWNEIYSNSPDAVKNVLDRMGENLSKQTMSFASEFRVMDGAQGIAKAIPGVLIWVIIFVIALFFMVAQKESVNAFISRLLGEKGRAKLVEFKRECRIYFWGYIKAQLILMLIIFVLISVILWLFGAPYSIAIAAVTALLDALPVLGSGLTLWPLAVIYFMNGNLVVGIGYIATYIAVQILRRILEPKLVSDKMGMNPILTLFSMYVGYVWWGIIGLLIGPMILMLLVSLWKMGIFNKPVKAIRQLWRFAVKELKIFTAYINKLTK